MVGYIRSVIIVSTSGDGDTACHHGDVYQPYKLLKSGVSGEQERREGGSRISPSGELRASFNSPPLESPAERYIRATATVHLSPHSRPDLRDYTGRC